MSLRHPVPAVQLYLWHVSYLLPLSQGQGTRVPSRTRAVSLVRSLARSYPHSPSPPTFISCPFVLVLYLSSAHLLSPTLTLFSHFHFLPFRTRAVSLVRSLALSYPHPLLPPSFRADSFNCSTPLSLSHFCILFYSSLSRVRF